MSSEVEDFAKVVGVAALGIGAFMVAGPIAAVPVVGLALRSIAHHSGKHLIIHASRMPAEQAAHRRHPSK